MTAPLTFSRETIFAALFALVSPSTVYTWKGTPSRRLKLWGDVPVDQRPIIYQFEGGEEDYVWKNNYAAPIVTLHAQLFVYLDSHDHSVVGATQMNQVIDALHTALAPDNANGRLTLGGLVNWARIEGKVFRDPGDLDGDGLIRVPILINVNA